MQAIVGSDEIETYMVEAAGISARKL